MDDEKVIISNVASTILLPNKKNDPGSFTIRIATGNGKETYRMLDLGAELNLIPYSIFEQLKLRDLKPIRICLQLADRSLRYPKGIIENIIVNIDGLIIPADFVVLEVGEVSNTEKEHTILLGRSFTAV